MPGRASVPALPDLYRLSALEPLGIDLGRVPMTVKVLLENALRHAGRGIVRPDDVETLAGWQPGGRGRDPTSSCRSCPAG